MIGFDRTNGFRSTMDSLRTMSRKFLVLAAIVAGGFSVNSQDAEAQVSVNIGVAAPIGVAPVCPYGYYDFAPYSCAPAGYYGPEWFAGGVFIGAGPWFHGPAGFHGHVNNRFDPRHGYRGPLPGRGERVEPERRVDAAHFRGNEERDGHGDGRGRGGEERR